MSKLFATVSPGQSNEQGSGYIVNSIAQTVINRNAGLGSPLVEPMAPHGGYNTWWAQLSALMGARGHILNVANCARGATGLCDVWIGRCKTWQTGKPVAPGAYKLNAGGIWKATGIAIGTVVTTITGPTGTSDITLDTIVWQYKGVPTARDIDGRVYEESDTLRFDPNGLLAVSAALHAAATGYDAKLTFGSIGQGDKTTEVTAAEYCQGWVSAADYYTSRGIYLIIGMTCYGATAGLDAWYTNELLPGRATALIKLANNPLVKAGANLRESLGILPVENSAGPGLSTPALQADNLHLNPAAVSAAADAWNTQMQRIGW